MPRIERSFTVTESRRLVKAIGATSDPTLAALRDDLADEIERLTDKRPWRAVVDKHHSVIAEMLECGHTYTLKSGASFSSWIEPNANKRRCGKCPPAGRASAR